MNDQKDTTSFINIDKNRENHFFPYLNQARYSPVPNCRGGSIKEGGLAKMGKKIGKILKLSMGGM